MDFRLNLVVYSMLVFSVVSLVSKEAYSSESKHDCCVGIGVGEVITEIRYEISRPEGWVENPKRTPEQTDLLRSFAIDMFEQNIPWLTENLHHLNSSELFKHFGRPTAHYFKMYKSREWIEGDLYTADIGWTFPGMKMGLKSSVRKINHFPEEVWIDRVTITSPEYLLKGKLSVGSHVSKFRESFGDPDIFNKVKNVMKFSGRKKLFGDKHTGGIFTYVIEAFQVRIYIGDDEKIEKVIWTWDTDDDYGLYDQ